MTEQDFVARNQERWRQFKYLLQIRGKDRKVWLVKSWQYPVEYRRICRDLNQAKAMRFSPGLLTMLNQLVLDGHQHIYRRHRETGWQEIGRAFRDFPASLMQHWRLFAACHLLFYGLVALAFGFGQMDPLRLEKILGHELCANIDAMYDPASQSLLRPEGVKSDADMFGYYIYNNISVGFRTFAAGLLAGLGSLFMVAFNGVYMGLIMAYVNQEGYNAIFYQFVLGHGSFELTAILIYGMAGFLLGKAVLSPGRNSRSTALRLAGGEVLPMVYGATVFLVIAAALEGFWSASAAPAPVKFIVADILWTLVYGYIIIGGIRGRR